MKIPYEEKISPMFDPRNRKFKLLSRVDTSKKKPRLTIKRGFLF